MSFSEGKRAMSRELRHVESRPYGLHGGPKTTAMARVKRKAKIVWCTEQYLRRICGTGLKVADYQGPSAFQLYAESTTIC